MRVETRVRRPGTAMGWWGDRPAYHFAPRSAHAAVRRLSIDRASRSPASTSDHHLQRQRFVRRTSPYRREPASSDVAAAVVRPSHPTAEITAARLAPARPGRRAPLLLLDAAGVRRACLHDARHTAATLLLIQGVPARVVMQILGHSQITLTLGTYSHVVPELAHDAARRMNDALWGREGR